MKLKKLLAALAATFLANACISTAPVNQPAVTVSTGDLSGAAEDGVESWKGIPFAKPPVGDLRWRAPQPAQPWGGVRDASTFASDCTQLPFGSEAFNMRTETSEDCLYLNIWRPEGDEKDLPVLVWIYGGGWVIGGTSAPVYEGANLAKKGLVVVSLNYRLGHFGFFAHPRLTEENADNGQFFNYGTLDQIAALEWINENISRFGGDSNNITVMGESAGGVSIHALITSPMNDGLFHKAIIMSGADGGDLGTGTLDDAEDLGVNLALRMGVSPDDPRALEKLRATPATELIDGLTFLTPPRTPLTFNGGGPIEDGKIVAEFGESYSSGKYQKIPLMIGATADDLGGRTGFMVAGARRISQQLASQNVPVFQYRFSYVPPASPDETAVHAIDIPFFMQTLETRYGDAVTATDFELASNIADYVAKFAEMDPTAPSLGDWSQYSNHTDEIMHFSVEGTAKMIKDPWADEIDASPAPKYPGLAAGGGKPEHGPDKQ